MTTGGSGVSVEVENGIMVGVDETWVFAASVTVSADVEPQAVIIKQIINKREITRFFSCCFSVIAHFFVYTLQALAMAIIASKRGEGPSEL